MKFLFWFSFSLIFIVYFGYPLFLYILTLFKRKPIDKRDVTPFITLVIPAHNEEAVIEDKLKNALALNYPKDRLEIIVVSDCSNDRTEEIVKAYTEQNVKLLIQRERKGKMEGLNNAIPKAKGEIIVFTDASTIFDKNAVKKLVHNFNDERIGCVSGNFSYISSKGPNAEVGGNLYTKYEMSLWNMESKLQSLLVTCGAIYAIRKSIFSPINPILADDFVNPINAAAKGYGIVYEPEAMATEKVIVDTNGEFSRKARTISQGYVAFINMLRVILSLGPIRSIQYIVHKFLRWLIPLYLITLFVSNAFLLNIRFYGSIFALQVIFYTFAIFGYWLEEKKIKINIFSVPFYFCLINTASLMGLFIALRGKQTGIWEKAETAR